MISDQLRSQVTKVFGLSPDAQVDWDGIAQAFNAGNKHPNELEQVLVDRLSRWKPDDAPLITYLMECYDRIQKGLVAEPSSVVLAESKYFVLSYAGLVLMIPSMFQQDEAMETLGCGLLIKMMIETPNSIPTSFLADLLARYEGEEGLEDLVTGFFGYLLERFKRAKIIDPCGALFAVLEYLISFRSVADILPRKAVWWQEGVTAADLNTKTLLGAIFGVIPTGEILSEVLPMMEESSQGQIVSAYTTLRLALNSYSAQVHSFLLKGIKAGPVMKEAIIQFMADVAKLNRDRAKMRYDPRSVSSDGLVMNIFRVLVRFCDPFLGQNNPKADLIDEYYHETSERLPTDGLTKINMEDSQYAKWKAEIKGQPSKANFISEMYYIALYFFRISYVTLISSISNMDRIRRDLADQLERLREELRKDPTNPLLKMHLKRMEDQAKYIEAAMRLSEIQLLDTEFLESVYLLISLMMSWMLKLAKATEVGNLPAEPEKRFLSLPEHTIETVSEVVLFISRATPSFWSPSRPVDALVRFLVTFLDRPDCIKNPYIRSKFIDIMHGWTAPSHEQIFDLYPVMVNQLAGKLMRFYIEVERTGASSQFYDKFNMRYSISMIFRCLWLHPVYKERIQEASEDRGTFIQFINFILNDISFLLDEAMMKLTEIHQYQQDEASGAIARLPEEEKKARMESFQKTESMCTAYTQLGGETLNMLAYLTRLIQEPFLQDEVIDHFSAMLNYNLVHLAGPKCRDLKVQNPEKYHFYPKVWLEHLIQVFLNFHRKAKFLEALARDGRSFQPETFMKASGLIVRLGIGSETDANVFRDMISRVQAIQQQDACAEEDLGDIPDEFIDPLMATLMEDPVILTTSGTTVDRKTIVAHLLNHKIDPFNRMPITMEQVLPDVELKARIDQFMAEKRCKQ